MVVGATKATGLAIILAGFALPSVTAAQPIDAGQDIRADSAAVEQYVAARRSDVLAPLDEQTPQAVTLVTQWVSSSGDNHGLPFMIVDKTAAEVFAFDADGQRIGQAPALLGITRGDDAVPGVGDRELRKIPVADRTTPAGRFVAKFGPAVGHRNVLWVDYNTSVSLHPVITSNPKEHRLQRIKSPAPDDNRITFGCINVPAQFYAKVVRPLFGAKAGGVVYILPDVKPLPEVFPMIQLQQAAGF